MQDCIPISREIFDNWIYADAEFFKVWITMLAKARYAVEPKQGMYQGIKYTQNRGEFIFGRPTWCEDTGISDKRLRRLIELLIKDGMIELVNKYSKFTIYKIVNYEKFNPKKGQQNDQQPAQETQGNEGTEGQQKGWQKSSKGPAEGWQRANKEESKEREEGKEGNIPYGEIIDSLNETVGTKYRVTDTSKKHIRARWNEGHRIDDFKTVIDKKTAEWLGTEQGKYLRPETLFGTKFDSYLNQPRAAPTGQRDEVMEGSRRFLEMVKGGAMSDTRDSGKTVQNGPGKLPSKIFGC